MRLHPNPPRLVTVALAVALAVIGFIYAWPVDPLIPVLAPVADALSGIGLHLNRELGYLGLFASGCLMVAGSLLPGI
ncbi:MAG: hypothetical protein ACYC65_15370 [Candidatus Limnocylindrales bacterium]